MNAMFNDIEIDLDKVDKRLRYAILYYGFKAVLQRIDEEGGSAVFAAIKFGDA